MSGRSGYSDSCEGWGLIRWRGQVASAIRGKRGQRLLRDMIAALDAMPVKELIADKLEDGEKVCALGAVGRARGVNMADLDPYDRETIAERFDIAGPLAAEVAFENDGWHGQTPYHRWERMRAWAAAHLRKP